jgi:REP element-mobilizing transposase RayT
VATSSPPRARTHASREAEQLPLFAPRAQRGGKRRGAGRPAKRPRAGSPHKTRPELVARHPVHVVLRTVAAIGNLRTRSAYRAIREATLTTARREDFRIVHASIQRTHIHLLVEANDKQALAAGMQGFQISAAKHLNAAVGARSAVAGEHAQHGQHASSRPPPWQRGPRRRGTVFPDRYHATIITTPRQARHVLAYIMGNFRKHEEDRAQPMSNWTIDWFSTAAMFPGWAEYGDAPFLWRGPKTYDPLVVYQPRAWLLREGWKLHGPISCHEVPSANRERSP